MPTPTAERAAATAAPEVTDPTQHAAVGALEPAFVEDALYLPEALLFDEILAVDVASQRVRVRMPTDVDLPLQDASAPVPADAQDSHLIDFEISGMGSEPMQLEVAPALAHPTSAPADTGVAAAIAETRYRTSVEAETVAGAHAAAANASRFDALPAKLALVRELTQAGEPQHAAEVAQEIAALIAELRSEAFHIMVAAQRRA